MNKLTVDTSVEEPWVVTLLDKWGGMVGDIEVFETCNDAQRYASLMMQDAGIQRSFEIEHDDPAVNNLLDVLENLATQFARVARNIESAGPDTIQRHVDIALNMMRGN